MNLYCKLKKKKDLIKVPNKDSKEKTYKRNSSIELLKIISLFLIVINHSCPFYGNESAISFIPLGVATENASILIINILRICGNLGNLIFVICSAWFLLDSKRTKKEKVLNILTDSLCISILWLIPFIILRIPINMSDFIKSFLPTTFANNWFIGCYLLLYIIHPFLNKIIEKTDKKGLFRINLILLILYSIIPMIKVGLLFESALLDFITIYFIMAYIKKYMNKFTHNKKLNLIFLFIGLSVSVCGIIILNYIGLKFPVLSNEVLHFNYGITNPFYILMGISLFNLFITKSFFNNKVNYLSSISLIFYLIHENMLFRTYIRPKFYEAVFPYGCIILWIFVEAILLFIFGFILSILYDKVIRKSVNKLSLKLYNIFKKDYIKIENYIIKKEF